MSISSSSLTLQQYAQQSNDPFAIKIVDSLLHVGTVLNDIPFTTQRSMKVNGARLTGQLGTANWRKINASSVVASSTISPFQEQLYVLSNMIDIDRLILMDQNAIGDPAAVQVNAMLEAWNYDFNNTFFNNNHVSGNADAFVGIRQRLDDPTNWGTASTCKIDGGGVDLSDSGMTAATANKFIRFLAQMLDAMGNPDGMNTVFYMNRDVKRRLDQAVRLLGAGAGFDTTQDNYPRRVDTFRNAKIRPVGVKGDQTTEIITSTETSAGANGSSNYSSVYAVHYGDDQFNGWQMEPPRIEAIGLRSDEPTIYRVFMEWPVGLYQQNIRSISRLFDVKVS